MRNRRGRALANRESFLRLMDDADAGRMVKVTAEPVTTIRRMKAEGANGRGDRAGGGVDPLDRLRLPQTPGSGVSSGGGKAQ